MKILRTDSGGGSYADERLKVIKSICQYFKFTDIDLLHDHKGCLTVFWKTQPSENDKNHLLQMWETMGESQIEHKLITFIDL